MAAGIQPPRNPNWLIHVSQSPASLKVVDTVKNVYEVFYTAAQNAYASAKALDIPRSQTFIFMGDPKTGEITYTRFARTDGVKLEMDQFVNSIITKAPNRCEKAADFFKEYFHTYTSDEKRNTEPEFETLNSSSYPDLLDLDDDGTSDISGASSLENFDQAMSSILKQAQPGDKVFFNYAGNIWFNHLQKIWRIPTGKGFINVETLTGLGQKFKSRGIQFHLNIMGCFSGGFSQVTDLVGQNVNTCVTTSTDSTNYYRGSLDPAYPQMYDRIFMQNWIHSGNQLESYACALGTDTLAFPESSLDVVTAKWESTLHENDGRTLLEPLHSLIDKELNGLEGMTADPLRIGLLQAYKSSIISPITRCNNGSEATAIKELNSCFDDPSFVSALGERIAPESKLREHYRDPLQRFEKGAALDRINRHLRLILKSDDNTLEKFKQAFCCLASSFKTDQKLKICSQ